MRIYTDGATSNNGYDSAQGGWAYIIVDEDDNIISKSSGYIQNATNNICELTAVIKACESINNLNHSFTIYSDSSYIINCWQNQWYENWLQNGWLNSKKEPVANKELWIRLIPYFKNSHFFFQKVKGHSGNYFNELVDKMAVEAKSHGGD